MLPTVNKHHGTVAEEPDHAHIRRCLDYIQDACNKQYCEMSQNSG